MESIPAFIQTGQMLRQALSVGAFPSYAAAVGTHESILFKRIEGDAAVWPVRRPAGESTRYDLASLSKWLATTLVALRLIDQGKLDLDHSINRYMDVPNDKTAVTIRHLLCHTAGFEAHFMLRNGIAPPQDAAKEILSRPLAGRPGQQVIYSCMGFILLGRLLEQISGHRLDQLAHEWIFQPLGMTGTGYRPISGHFSKSTAESVAATELDPLSGHHICGQVHDENARFLGGVSGNAGVFAPLSDLILIARCMLNRGQGLITPELFDLMIMNWTEGLNQARGLGVVLWPKEAHNADHPFYRTGAFGHTGFTGTSMVISPEQGLYFILLTNRVHFGRNLPIMPDYRTRFHEAALNDVKTLHP